MTIIVSSAIIEGVVTIIEGAVTIIERVVTSYRLDGANISMVNLVFLQIRQRTRGRASFGRV